ncbi:MAG: energy transducer TonB [Alphaproteobacteria bacterium]|nr:energy transducer TonB [Alphaproteobacteria bacterium]
MIFSSYKKLHVAAFTAAALVHGGITAWSLMPSDPVVLNKQAIQVSFVAPSSDEAKSEKIFYKDLTQKSALKQEKESEKKLSQKTSGHEDPNATAIVAAESEPVFDAEYLNNPAPSYPAAARQGGTQGKVLLSVVVKTDGTPALVEVSHSSGSRDLDEAALVAVRQWKFIPARSHGQFVQASVIVPVEFKII